MKLKTIISLSAIALLLGVFSYWVGQWSYSWLPPQASVESQLVDRLFSTLVAIGTFILFGVAGTMTYSILFHRAGRYDTSDGPPIEGNVTLEIVWTTIPFLIVIYLAYFSYQTYREMNIQAPGHMHQEALVTNVSTGKTTMAMPVTNVEVTAKQWAWIFHYPEKNVTSTELHLPVNQRAHFILRSPDVIHGFFIPAFRVKQDVIPFEDTDFEFTPIKTGKYRIRDSQFSGTYFAAMQADVVVESQEDYQTWLNQAARQPPTPAPNQAVSEYARRQQKEDRAAWKTVPPAPPPVVNYHP
ncbi:MULTISPECIES: cytochrome c oxidase subunit II [Cyanophyceae]|uniref:cytochrome c oxidase subunit II n=1 Tax=Cyanophyceae TaxID=3028117 RepID=UPI00000B33ED|nr:MULTISPECIES: cytochrome c oxidase subunit II [Cyanophyceae]AAN03590.1 cytochrome oxidase II [Picosynechococcus sp. PCC 7002]ACA98732.1 Cytochrome C oxidase subunit II [Picosynechococcus sp. PCC 7002]SMH39413.1 cytochrome c oxidase subunit 2 [Picosynechococcus sp. OG1]SMQ78178.1 cytochrome c oxidase subunit 2 [Synechococcus sp. 7002]